MTAQDSSAEAPGVDRSARRNESWPASVEIFDTTLRDGVQFEGISVSSEDKLKVARQLDALGVHWIEGGYPGANPKDRDFFDRAKTELDLTTAQLVAFGSTRRPLGRVDQDATLDTLVTSGAGTACIVGKSWDYHVTHALRTTLDEAVAMVGDSVRFLVEAGLRVFFDAEHFFDGHMRNPEFALSVLESAATNGADVLVLCDTNGGSLPDEVERIVHDVVRHFDLAIGIHTQNDTGCAVANAMAAVRAGATQVQGTMNGYGERTGNCDNTQLIPNLTLKMGIETLPEGRLQRLSGISLHVAELLNMPPMHQQPYVGKSAFAHKAGLHTSAIARRPDSYEHVDPTEVGNHSRFLVSDLSGRATIDLKAKELGVELDGAAVGQLVTELKQLEHEGYHFEVADASLEILMRRAGGLEPNWFDVESFRVVTDRRTDASFDTEATVKVLVGDERRVSVGEGNGPVNSLDAALRNAVGEFFPEIAQIHLTDYKVRVIDSASATAAVTRVLIDQTDGTDVWTTIGVSENIIEASWLALRDGIYYGLLRNGR
ncbi:MAG: citramalate synthase [Actinobacteria bacterium]|nr:citramalate synthase [Actinomycetota bacterium]